MRAHFWRRAAVWAGGGLLVVFLCGVAGAYLWTEYLLRRTHDAPLVSLPLPTDAASLERGRLRATLVGCYDGCHGPGATGSVWEDDWWIAHVTAPNLTEVIRDYGDAELVRLLRHGIRRDGTVAFTMPAVQFRHLSDDDLGAIIAFLKSLPRREGVEYRRGFGPRGRIGLLTGEFVSSMDDVDVTIPLAGEKPPATALERGRYIAMITCPECHGPDLAGYPGDTPPLLIVAAYSFAEFTTLMRTGVAKGGRDAGLMSSIGRKRTPTLSDQEVADLYAYLQSRVPGGAVSP